MSIKLIALDIDGTLFDSQGRISPRTIKAIKECTDKGIYIVFSTGRDFDALPLLCVRGSGMQYAITTNGSSLYELQNRRCIWEDTIPDKDIFQVLDYCKEKDVFPYIFIDGHGYAQKDKLQVFSRVNWPEHLMKETEKNMNVVESLSQLVVESPRGVQKGAVLFPEWTDLCKEHEIVSKVQNRIWNETIVYLDSIQSIHAVDGGCANLEFNRQGCTKAVGLRRLCEILEIPIGCTMAVGDSVNDLEILKAAGVSVAMGNAQDRVKSLADYVTDTNDDEGVAKVLERLII